MKLFYLLYAVLYFQPALCRDRTHGVVRQSGIALSINTINPTCQKKNGRIVVSATGGTAPYDYQISGPFASQPSGIFFGLPAGSYTITVTDVVGTVATQNITLTNSFSSPSANASNKVNPSGCSSSEGSFRVNGSGGAPPYMYSLDNVNFQPSDVFSNLSAGSYQFSVKDANGCSSFPAVIMNNVVTLSQNCSITIPEAGGTILCSPVYSFGINLSNVSGGTPAYTYSSDGVNYQSSSLFTGLAPGLNTFWVKDATGLTALYSRSTMDDCPQPFSIKVFPQPAQCGINGAMNIIASDGQPPYAYSLDGVNFQSGNLFTALAPGIYTVTVRDADNLTVSRLVDVPDNCVVVTASIISSSCSGNNGRITAQASNGTAPYQYSLDGVTYGASNVFANLAPANYVVYAKDAAGEVGKAAIVISNISGPQINAINITATGCDNHSGSIDITASAGTIPYSYSIDGTAFQSGTKFNGIGQGSYTTTVKDANGCTFASQAVVPFNGMLPVVQLGNDTTLCEGDTKLLIATNTNSTYLWQDNSSSPTYLVTMAGRYFVAVDKQGCIAKDTINIAYNLKPRFTLGADGRICTGSTLTLDPKISGVNYLWQDGSTGPTFTITQPGLYTLTASNTCGLTTQSITIGTGICDLYVPNSFTPNSDSRNDLFKALYGDNVTEFHMQVFNRYGQLVFESKDKSEGWDGNFKGKRQPYDTYVWMIQYKAAVNNILQKLQGTVLLIR